MKSYTKRLLLGLSVLSINIMMISSYRLPNHSSRTSNLATVVGEGRFYKTVVFNSDVTVSSANALTIASPDSLTLLAESTDKVTITAESTITGITAAKFPTLTTTASTGTGVVIDGNVIINGNLFMKVNDYTTDTTGGSLTINGDLIVIGNTLVEPRASLTVKGNVILDGDGRETVELHGNVTVTGQTSTGFDGMVDGFDGSPNQQGNLTIRNAYTAAATTLNPEGGTITGDYYYRDSAVIIGGISATAMTFSVDGSVIIENCKNDAAATDVNCIYFYIRPTLTIGKDLIVRNNVGGGGSLSLQHMCTLYDNITINVGRDFIFEDNTGLNGRDATAGVATVGAEAFGTSGNSSSIIAQGSIKMINNTGGTGGNGGAGGNAGKAGADCIDITHNLVMQAAQDIIIHGNTGGSGGTSITDALGANGGKGLFSANNSSWKAAHIQISGNQGGAGSDGVGTSRDAGDGAGAVEIALATLEAVGDITFADNTGGAGGAATGTGDGDADGGSGGVAVIINNVTVNAHDVKMKNNTGGAGGAAGAGTAGTISTTGGAGSAGGAGGEGVLFDSSSTTNVYATMSLISNTGGAGGAGAVGGIGLPGGAGGIGGDGGNAVRIAGTATIDTTLTTRNNTGGVAGAGGAGGAAFTGSNGDGGNGGDGGPGGDGYSLTGTVTVNSNKVTSGNSGGSGGAGGTGGALDGTGANGANGTAGSSGSATNITGTCTTPDYLPGKTVYETATSTSSLSGPINEDVCVLANFTVDSNFTINGDLVVKGTVDIQSGNTLTVNGNVLFDGQSGNKQVTIEGVLVAHNVTIANYVSTADHAVDVASTGSITSRSDITIKNNSTSAATSNGVIAQGDLTATSGTISLRENSSSTDHGVEISGSSSIEAVNIVFNTNSSTEADSNGVHIDDATVQAHNDMRYIYNFGGATSGNGVHIGEGSTTTIRAANLHVVVTCTSQRQHFVIDSNTIKEDFYGATLFEHISNTGTACTVDIIS